MHTIYSVRPFSVFLAVLLLLSLLTGCHNTAPPPVLPVDEAKDVNTYIVEIDTVQSLASAKSIDVSGMVVTDEEARPGFKTGGVIAALLVEENDNVRRGQVIARLDVTEITAQVAQADLAVDKAQRDLERVRNLYQDSVATLEQFQNVQTGLAVAERQRDIATFNQQYSVLRAPITGRVIRKLTNAGEVIGPGQPVCIIQGTRTSDWQVKAALTDDDWATVKPGDPAQVRLDAYPDITLTAKVDEVGTIANPGGGTFPVTLQLQPAELRLAAGLIGRVIIEPQKSSTGRLTIPVTAIVDAAGTQAKVFVPGAAGKAYAKKITLGPIRGDRVVVTSGLTRGDTVITTGSAWLRENDPIALAPLR